MKRKNAFFCTECGNEAIKWSGQCAACGAWNTMAESPEPKTAPAPTARRRSGGPLGTGPKLLEDMGDNTELRFSSVGPLVGRETTRAAFLAILATSVVTLLFVALAFRKVPHAWRYAVCAILKMLFDILFLLGVASILGHLVGWEVDSLFLTAVLTVVGFSVQDVIVVFDRIRENVPKYAGEPFDQIIDRSLTETLKRSLTTQLNAIFVMVAIILFGGVTIRQFLLTMLIGMVAGTYSSLFFAVPLLSVWHVAADRRAGRAA